MARQRKTKGTLTRRAVLKRGAALTGAAAASGAITGFPMVWAQNIKDVTLRQFGTGVSNINAIAEKAKEDLGITLQMTALDTDSTAQRVVTQPKGFDIADIEYFTLKKVWGAGNMQPMDISRLQYFDKIVGIFKDGRLTPTSKIAQGTAPHTVSFVEKPGDKTFASGMTNWYTMVPTIYNADTLGIRPDLINRPIESWTELLNPEFRGKASILNIASIGIMDAAMVCEAMGEVQYGDKGNMTKEEIDKTMAIFTEAKKAGQFRAFWKTFDESVNLMASGEVVIQSMWSPAITKVRSMGIPCVYQPLKEGYRSWGGRARHLREPVRSRARCGVRVRQLVPLRLGRRAAHAPGLLLRGAGDLQGPHVRRRVGLLVRGQARAGRHHQPVRPEDGVGRRGARRRLVPRADGRGRVLELGDGREPLHGAEVERVHRGIARRRAVPMNRRAGGIRRRPLLRRPRAGH